MRSAGKTESARGGGGSGPVAAEGAGGGVRVDCGVEADADTDDVVGASGVAEPAPSVKLDTQLDAVGAAAPPSRSRK